MLEYGLVAFPGQPEPSVPELAPLSSGPWGEQVQGPQPGLGWVVVDDADGGLQVVGHLLGTGGGAGGRETGPR